MHGRKNIILRLVCLPVLPRGTPRLPLDGFSLNFVFEYFSKTCREKSSFIKIGQEKRVLYMKTNKYFLSSIFRLWRYGLFWTLASLRRRLHSSLSSARLLHPRIPRICDVSLRTTSSHLALGFPTSLAL